VGAAVGPVGAAVGATVTGTSPSYTS